MFALHGLTAGADFFQINTLERFVATGIAAAFAPQVILETLNGILGDTGVKTTVNAEKNIDIPHEASIAFRLRMFDRGSGD